MTGPATAYTRKASVVMTSAQPMIRRVASSTTAIATIPRTRSGHDSGSTYTRRHINRCWLTTIQPNATTLRVREREIEPADGKPPAARRIVEKHQRHDQHQVAGGARHGVPPARERAPERQHGQHDGDRAREEAQAS